MKPYASDRVVLETFVGRGELLAQARSHLLNGRSIMLSAGRRTGKTMFLRRLQVDLQAKGVKVVYLDSQALPAPANANSTLDFVLAAAGWSGARLSLLELAEATVGSGHKWCLLIDEVERFARVSEGIHFLDNVRHIVSNSSIAGEAITGVCGGLDLTLELRSSGSSLTNVCHPLALEPFTNDELRELVALGCPATSRAKVAEYMAHAAGGHPFVAQMLLEGLPSAMLPDVPEELVASAVARVQVHVAGLDPMLLDGAEEVARGTQPEPYLVPKLCAAGIARRDNGSVEVNGDVVRRAVESVSANRRFREGSPEMNAMVGQFLVSGESETVEYKESIRWDVRSQIERESLRDEIVQAVAGFMNAEGGVLLIGVTSDGTVAGLEPDMKLIKRNPTPDGLCLMVANMLRDRLGGSAAGRVSFNIVVRDGKPLLVLAMERAPRPVFARVRDADRFYRRIGTSTVEFDARETVEYVLQRWPDIADRR